MVRSWIAAACPDEQQCQASDIRGQCSVARRQVQGFRRQGPVSVASPQTLGSSVNLPPESWCLTPERVAERRHAVAPDFNLGF